jgi:hypothetical protein
MFEIAADTPAFIIDDDLRRLGARIGGATSSPSRAESMTSFRPVT